MKIHRKIVSYTLALLAITGALLFAGCGTTRLESGGAYAPVGQVPDMQFYVVDVAYDLAYSTIDAAFKFERDNRQMLWMTSPNIKRTLDQIRPQAVEANARYLAARAVYMNHPVPSNLSTLETILAEVQRLTATATSLLPRNP